MRKLILLACALAALGLTGVAFADTPGKPLRLVGEAPTIGEAGPAQFVIDAVASPGDEAGETKVDGWFTATPPLTGAGEIEGKCIGARCELKVSLPSHTLKLTGDLLNLSGPAKGAFALSGDDDTAPPTAKGEASFIPFGDTAPGLGQMVRSGAVDSEALDDLLLWAGTNPSFGDDQPHPLEDTQHEHLASWQDSDQRPATGLLMTADLERLTALRAAAQAKAGWTRLGAPDQGWRAGYPAALLPKASRAGAQQHFASADGKAELVVAVDPPISGDEWDALVDKMHNVEADPDSFNFTRTGPDMQFSYTHAGKAVSAVYYYRTGGVARVVFTYPAGEGPYADIEPMIAGSLRVTSGLQTAP